MCAGAHDFALATASPAELVLRIRLLSSAMVRPVRKERRIGPLQVDRELRKLSVGAHSVSLSPIEFKMFEHLLLHAGRPASRSELQHAIWGADELAEHPTNIAVVYVSYLRRKLARLGRVCSITTITNVGYALDLDIRPENARQPAGGRRAH
jgi:DNA-binding response OmpR family regulator